MTNTRRDTTESRNGNDRLKAVIESLAIAALPQSGHPKSASDNGTCQGYSKPCSSGGFLLLNFGPTSRDSLALSLRLCGQRVFAPEEYGKPYSDLTDNEIQDFDYLFCDLTRRIDHDDFQKLRRICRLRGQDGSSIPKICLVPQDWAPEFQRFVGAEFEAHLIPCKARDLNLPEETIQGISSNESAGFDEGRTS